MMFDCTTCAEPVDLDTAVAWSTSPEDCGYVCEQCVYDMVSIVFERSVRGAR